MPPAASRKLQLPRQAEAFGDVLAEFLVAGLIGYFFVRRQLTQTAPLLPIDLLRIPVFALSIVTSFCSFTAQHMEAEIGGSVAQ